MLGLPQQKGYSSTRTFLLFLHDVFTRYLSTRRLPYSKRVTLPGLYRRSARDNSPTRDNLLPSYA